jgi:intracellular septation protein A
MKTFRISIIIFFLFSGSLVFSQFSTSKPTIRIALEKALETRGLKMAMYEQLNLYELLSGLTDGYITVRVFYANRVFEVYGKKAEWIAFFLCPAPGPQPETQRLKSPEQ